MQAPPTLSQEAPFSQSQLLTQFSPQLPVVQGTEHPGPSKPGGQTHSPPGSQRPGHCPGDDPGTQAVRERHKRLRLR